MKQNVKDFIKGTFAWACVGYIGICAWTFLSWIHTLCGVNDPYAEEAETDE